MDTFNSNLASEYMACDELARTSRVYIGVYIYI